MRIEVKDLTKTYKGKDALNGLSFTLNGDKIYGLLGRNGAGKTTFMKVLKGHILKSSGEVLINDEQPFDNQNISSSICFIKEGDNFKPNLKIREIFKLYSYFYPTWDQDLADELLVAFHLKADWKVKTLSKGMESALGITVGLSSKAPITLFDEPYIGLDAAARRLFYEVLLAEYQKQKRMIILSTHLIDEVSLMFEEVVILKNGQLELQENTESLREHTYAISGPIATVEAFISDKRILEKKMLAGMTTAYVEGDPEEARIHGFTPDCIPIQDLMISLTEELKEA